ncbi:hypothetical protein AB1Y20_009645 [Prymnesium parvum]|uniref:Uncharacterized protein n=1 Tax=Prymnesium parvum TaxID=97485 RepID=A0AB34K1E6_PRYPA
MAAPPPSPSSPFTAAPSEHSTTVFAAGLFLFLVLPLALALFVASRLTGRTTPQRELVPSSGDELSDWEEMEPSHPREARGGECALMCADADDARADGRGASRRGCRPTACVSPPPEESPSQLVPSRPPRKTRGKGSNEFTTICFRKGDWKSRLEKPLVMAANLSRVHDMTELSVAVRSAYEQALQQGLAQGDGDLGPITIECQLIDGEMVALTPQMERFCDKDVRALFVTTNLSESVVFKPSGSDKLPLTFRCASNDTEDGEEAGLIDLSLSGCCGVQSSHGGLRITSCTDVEDASPSSRKQRQADIYRFRASKLRHYFTM